jgi:hypothetical protein
MVSVRSGEGSGGGGGDGGVDADLVVFLVVESWRSNAS